MSDRQFSGVKGVVFDLNNTLIHWAPGSMRHVEALADRLELPVERVRSAMESLDRRFELGLSPMSRMERILRRLDLPLDKWSLFGLIELEQGECLRPVQLYPGVEQMLLGLQQMELPTVICSNGNPNTLFIARNLPPLDSMKAIFSCQIGERKPGPKLYREAAARIGFYPSECLYVCDGGDRSLFGARQLGMATVRCDHPEVRAERDPDDPYLAADRTVTAVADVVGLLEMARV